MTPEEIAQLATRLTVDLNTVPLNHSRYDRNLVLHLERHGGQHELWRVTSLGGEIYHHQAREWHSSYTYRDAEDRSAYLSDVDTAYTTARHLLAMWAQRQLPGYPDCSTEGCANDPANPAGNCPTCTAYFAAHPEYTSSHQRRPHSAA